MSARLAVPALALASLIAASPAEAGTGRRHVDSYCDGFRISVTGCGTARVGGGNTVVIAPNSVVIVNPRPRPQTVIRINPQTGLTGFAIPMRTNNAFGIGVAPR